MGLSVKDYRECVELIELIYSVSSESGPAEMFSMLCRRLERLIGISTANMGRINPRKRDLRVGSLRFCFPISPGRFIWDISFRGRRPPGIAG